MIWSLIRLLYFGNSGIPHYPDPVKEGKSWHDLSTLDEMMRSMRLPCLLGFLSILLQATIVQAQSPAIVYLSNRIATHLPVGAQLTIEPFQVKRNHNDIVGEESALGNFVSQQLFLSLFDLKDVQVGTTFRITGNAIRVTSGYQLEVELQSSEPDKDNLTFKPLQTFKESEMMLFTSASVPAQAPIVKESMTSVVAITGPTVDYTRDPNLRDPQDKQFLRAYSKSLDAVDSGKKTYQIDGGYLFPVEAAQYGVQLLRKNSQDAFFNPVSITEKEGQPFVDLKEGDRVAVKIVNRRPPNDTGKRNNTVGAILFVDGMSSLHFSKQWKPDVLFNVDPGKEKFVEGWHIQDQVYKEFLVSSRLDTEIASSGVSFSGKEGLIQVQIFEQRAAGKGLKIGQGDQIEGQNLKLTNLTFENFPIAVISIRFTHPGK